MMQMMLLLLTHKLLYLTGWVKMKKIIKVISCTIFLMVSGINVAAAGCIYNGYQYPVGTKVAGLTCQANGEWKWKYV